MQAATLEPKVGRALRYLAGKPGWVELYKAYEAVLHMPNGGISTTEIRRFKQTANTEGRHDPEATGEPHKCPMEFSEARAFVTRAWIRL